MICNHVGFLHNVAGCKNDLGGCRQGSGGCAAWCRGYVGCHPAAACACACAAECSGPACTPSTWSPRPARPTPSAHAFTRRSTLTSARDQRRIKTLWGLLRTATCFLNQPASSTTWPALTEHVVSLSRHGCADVNGQGLVKIACSCVPEACLIRVPPAQSGIPVVLHCVLCSANQLLRNVSPSADHI